MPRRVKLYKSRNWMWKKYIKEGLSEDEIAELAKCDPATINRWLHKLELKR